LAVARDPLGSFRRPGENWVWPVSGLALAGLAALLWVQSTAHRAGIVAESRNFYGLLRVRNESSDAGPVRALTHGRILHGMQFLDEENRRKPTTYFGRSSGLGLVLNDHPRRRNSQPSEQGLRIGVIGLGVGTIAAYGQPRDVIRFYEINPEVIRFAHEEFTYLADSAARIEIVEGDARLALEAELETGSQQFDVLVMDAFSSDAVPMHLLTRECAQIYWKHLEPDGILLCNIRNRSVDLAPLMLGLAEISGKQVFRIDSKGDQDGVADASWAVLTTNANLLADRAIQAARTSFSDQTPLIWTDDYGSLWQVLRR